MMEFEFPKYNLDVDFDDDTGFPFDDHLPPTADPPSSSSTTAPPQTHHHPFGSGRGEDSRLRFEDHLRDIAARYPEFAEHIRPSATAGRTSTSGGGGGGGAFPTERVRRDPWGRDEFDFGRDFDLPEGFGVDSGGRFHRPREFYPPNTQTYTASPPPFNTPPESRPPVYPQPSQATTTTTTKPTTQTSPITQPKPPISTKTTNSGGGGGGGIHQSNTVDLGQVQPPIVAQGKGTEGGGSADGGGDRGLRSMSAPPTSAADGAGKRYVSSIQIPVLQQPSGPQSQQPGQQTVGTDMGASNSTTPKQQQQPQPAPNKPHEYVIPIHIEGRDEPIIPKSQMTPHQQQNATTPLQQQQQYMQNQPPGQQNQQPLYNTVKDHFKQPVHDQVQRENQQKFYEQEQEQATKPSHQQVVKPTPLEMIQLIQKDVSELMGKVDKFKGKPKDKEYIYLDEMLTRNLLKLDNIETEGKDAIRQARREAIKCIEGCISILEAKANQNVALLMEELKAIEEKPVVGGEEVVVEESVEKEQLNNIKMEQAAVAKSGVDNVMAATAAAEVAKT